MQRTGFAVSAVLSLFFATGSALACQLPQPLDLHLVDRATIVVIGRISNFQMVRNVAYRQAMLADPHLPKKFRKEYLGKNNTSGDYARITIRVDQVLKGKAPITLSARWETPKFGAPETLAKGPLLIALSMTYPWPRPTNWRSNKRWGLSLAVLDVPCAGIFMFKARSPEADAVRAILKAKSK